jgi:hypothetical protein
MSMRSETENPDVTDAGTSSPQGSFPFFSELPAEIQIRIFKHALHAVESDKEEDRLCGRDFPWRVNLPITPEQPCEFRAMLLTYQNMFKRKWFYPALPRNWASVVQGPCITLGMDYEPGSRRGMQAENMSNPSLVMRWQEARELDPRAIARAEYARAARTLGATCQAARQALRECAGETLVYVRIKLPRGRVGEQLPAVGQWTGALPVMPGIRDIHLLPVHFSAGYYRRSWELPLPRIPLAVQFAAVRDFIGTDVRRLHISHESAMAVDKWSVRL